MKEFKLTADATFMAENIDDAFHKLAEHFNGLANKPNEGGAFFVGKMSIAPVKEI